jgi:hypothetical protein
MTGDRWNLSFVGDTDSVSPQSILGDADRAGIGDETATFQLVNIFTGNAAAGSYSQITQRVEGVRRLAGTTVTLSFWAKAAATQKLGINATQVFGSGGSPSAAVRVLATGNAVTLSTAWARYSSTFAIPSVSGKTLGTSGGDCTQLELWYSSGATLNAAAGNIGVQSGTIQLWGVQLEIGSVATPLEKPDPRYDVSNCQRFYQAYAQLLVSGYNAASGVVYNELILNTQMRAAPTVAFASQTFSNASVGSLNASAANHLELKTTITATGYGFTLGDVMLSADL